MPNRTGFLLTLVAAAAALVSACSAEHQTTVLAPTSTKAATTTTSTSNTSNAPGSLLGTWVSANTIGKSMTLPGSLSQCGNLQLTVTSQTATQASGRLTMDCPNGVQIAGTIVGQLGGANVPVTYTGAATQGSETCPFTMNGTFFPITSTSYRFEYTGQSCFGPIYGTETLRLGGGGGQPTPAPTTPTTPTTPTAVAGDMFPLTTAIIRNSPLNLASWPITTAIRVVEVRPNGIFVDFSKKDGPGRWPDYTPPGWDGPLQWTLGMVMSINGQAYASAPVEFWHGLEAAGGPPSQYAMNWFYDPARWAPMTYHQPAVGETIGLFACAGDCRNRPDGAGSPLKERSNVVTIQVPDDRGARFTF
jgi:hypothetical protein